MQQRVTPKSLIAENKRRDYGRVLNHLKLFFWIDLFKSSYKNNTLRHKSTKTLMSPRYSIVTSSIRGHDYAICITQSQIHLFNQHKVLQRVPQSLYRRVKMKTCANPHA